VISINVLFGVVWLLGGWIWLRKAMAVKARPTAPSSSLTQPESQTEEQHRWGAWLSATILATFSRAGNDVLGETQLMGATKVDKTSGVWIDSMAIIGWHNKPDSWVVAGWVFRQLLEDVCSQRPADSEVVSELELAKDLKYLFIDSFSGDLQFLHIAHDTASSKSPTVQKSFSIPAAVPTVRSKLL
jgi:hypothetical protein